MSGWMLSQPCLSYNSDFRVPAGGFGGKCFSLLALPCLDIARHWLKAFYAFNPLVADPSKAVF